MSNTRDFGREEITCCLLYEIESTLIPTTIDIHFLCLINVSAFLAHCAKAVLCHMLYQGQIMLLTHQEQTS